MEQDPLDGALWQEEDLETAGPLTSPHDSQSHLPQRTRLTQPKIFPYTSHLFRVRHQYTDLVVEEYPVAGEEVSVMEVAGEEEDAVPGKESYQ